MFGTWKYDPETDEVQNLRRAYDPITARSSQHQACNRCHGKKLKCSGDKDGCERCIAHGLSCEYTRLSSRGSRGGTKTTSSRHSHSRERESASSRSHIRSNPSPGPKRDSRHRQSHRQTPSGYSGHSVSSQADGESILTPSDFTSVTSRDIHALGSYTERMHLSPTPRRSSPGHYSSSRASGGHSSAYGSAGLDDYHQWPSSGSHDTGHTTTTDDLMPYGTVGGQSSAFYMGSDYEGSGLFTDYQPDAQFSSYTSDANGYASSLDPRYWPPSTQSGF